MLHALLGSQSARTHKPRKLQRLSGRTAVHLICRSCTALQTPLQLASLRHDLCQLDVPDPDQAMPSAAVHPAAAWLSSAMTSPCRPRQQHRPSPLCWMESCSAISEVPGKRCGHSHASVQVRGMDSSMLHTALEVQRLKRRNGNLTSVLQHLQVCMREHGTCIHLDTCGPASHVLLMEFR